MTISKKMESERQDKLNASAISYSRSRPLSPFAADNAFNLSKAGYANPGSLDRAGASAIKNRSRAANMNNPQPSKSYEAAIGQGQRGPLTQNIEANEKLDFGKYEQLQNHEMLFEVQATQQPNLRGNLIGINSHEAGDYPSQVSSKQLGSMRAQPAALAAGQQILHGNAALNQAALHSSNQYGSYDISDNQTYSYNTYGSGQQKQYKLP